MIIARADKRCTHHIRKSELPGNGNKTQAIGSEAYIHLLMQTDNPLHTLNENKRHYCWLEINGHEKYFIHENHEIRAYKHLVFLRTFICVIPHFFYSLPPRNFSVWFFLSHGTFMLFVKCAVYWLVSATSAWKTTTTKEPFLYVIHAIYHRKPLKSTGNEFR